MFLLGQPWGIMPRIGAGNVWGVFRLMVLRNRGLTLCDSCTYRLDYRRKNCNWCSWTYFYNKWWEQVHISCYWLSQCLSWIVCPTSLRAVNIAEVLVENSVSCFRILLELHFDHGKNSFDCSHVSLEFLCWRTRVHVHKGDVPCIERVFK